MSDKKDVYTKSQIEFYIAKKKYAFVIYHDLMDAFHMNIESAVHLWVHNTEDYSDQSLCDFIISKGWNAVTQKQWLEYISDKLALKINLKDYAK